MPKISLDTFGLSAEEEKIYLALIKLGPSGAMVISHESNLSRSTTYYHLESLLAKGLISQSFTGKKNIYSPAKPKVLSSIIKQKESDLATQKENLPTLIERIENIMKKETVEPEAQILKGKSGFLEAMNDILDCSGDIYFIGSHDIVLKDDRLFTTEYFLRNFTAKRRQKNKSVAWIISDASEITLRQQREEDTEFRKIKIWPALVGISGGSVIYGSKIIFFNVSEQATAYIIHNEITAELLKIIFKQIFSSLE